MKKNVFEIDRLVTILAFQGFALSLLCNLCVGLFMGGGLFLALEEAPSERSVFVAIIAMFGSVCVFMLAFFVLLGSLATTARIRLAVSTDELTITVSSNKTDNSNEKELQ
ncbi:MAG: hypothetical protein ACJAXJ_001555 [Colwellia sp.]|jgi:hypothetical protein